MKSLHGGEKVCGLCRSYRAQDGNRGVCYRYPQDVLKDARAWCDEYAHEDQKAKRPLRDILFLMVMVSLIGTNMVLVYWAW